MAHDGRHWLRPGSIASALVSLVNIGVPMALGRAIDDGVVAGDATALAGWLALVALAYVVRAAAQTARMQTNVGAAVSEHDLRVQALERIIAPEGIGGPPRLPGDLLSVLVTDVRTVSRSFIALASIPGNVVTLFGSLIAMALINGWLVLATVCTIPLLILLSVKGVAPVKRSTRRERRAEAAVAGSAADLTSGLRVIQGLSASRRATVRFRVVSREGLAATLRTRRVRGVYTGTVNASVGVFITVLTVLAGWLTLDGRISVGSLVTVVGLAQTLGPPLRALGVDTATMLANAHASGDRFCELHDSPAAWQVPPDDSERPAPAGRPDGNSRINSSESPNGCPDANPTGNPTHSDSPPLHTPVHLHVQVEDPSLQLDVPPGAHLGIVAPQQVCDALAQDIVHGSHTLLNGVPASQLSPARKRALVLVAPRSPELFDDTVQANIMLGSTRDDMLDAVVRAAALDTTIAELPHGLQTGVGEGGRHVSGGQRQRLALARALLHAPDGLVLIDPTTSIDAATTAAIAERMGELRAGRTTLIATTSPALLDRMDEVVLFDDDGHLVARAPHRELLGHDGYREMLS
ncbi:MAG: ABC transporter ATP-binding protein [Cutibacterium granulosum]|uniref:ABC transporter ATP-binding protein n=1 Tax=Cutibacterium granulosum TaxID=33011 RepID=UPI002B23EB37|nr:ABC transporter ATP-binding protein [Cutibacterium granulosum]MEA5648794.1 ABC transporter ATP-binding protein [Cutibacterium granulosum]MEA5653695.1 ABC transporter ATP-binding protein [Cutibacterium granulosum]MEA5657351.1 ABC transporter ATP-binding protein [Cutibacterium granulosum]MEA5663404.1 ABC transporter ATP-binding protein [Cutibacterium granulosum]